MEYQLLTPDEVADFLRIATDDVIVLVEDGKLSAMQVRGQLRITADSLQNFVSEQLQANNLRVIERKLRDPFVWARFLEQSPDLAARIEREEYPKESMGAFLKEALAVSRARNSTQNVLEFHRRDSSDADDS